MSYAQYSTTDRWRWLDGCVHEHVGSRLKFWPADDGAWTGKTWFVLLTNCLIRSSGTRARGSRRRNATSWHLGPLRCGNFNFVGRRGPWNGHCHHWRSSDYYHSMYGIFCLALIGHARKYICVLLDLIASENLARLPQWFSSYLGFSFMENKLVLTVVM